MLDFREKLVGQDGNVRFLQAGGVKAPSPPRSGRVALLGIAQRTIHVKYPVNRGNQKRSKVLKLNIKTAGDWLKVKRIEKKLMPYHVAGKMGIATSLICSWESSTRQPDAAQLKVLA